MNPNQADKLLKESIRRDRKFLDHIDASHSRPRYRMPNSESFDAMRSTLMAMQHPQAAAGVSIVWICITIFIAQAFAFSMFFLVF